MTPRLPSLLPALLLPACELPEAFDTTAARIAVAPLAQPILDGDPRPLEVVVTTAKGKRLPEAEAALTWSAVPAGVVDVSGGALRCVGSGDASVLVAGAGVSATFGVMCRVVAAIRGPTDTVTLVVGDPDVPLRVEALDTSGAVLAGVAPSLRSSAPGVFGVLDGAARAVKVGRGTLLAEVGAARASFPVIVHERLANERIAVPDGASLVRSLPAGSYLVEVVAAADDGSGHGVSVSFRDAACPPSPEATTHTIACAVSAPTELAVTNPTAWGFGPTAFGQITVYAVP
ncbi:MAG: hypothetical protein ACK4YP_26405 [Myxococcota bacterium]